MNVETPVVAVEAPSTRRTLRVAYLLTTFPRASETFIQRELRVIRGQQVGLEIHSLWKGGGEWEGLPVRPFPALGFFKVPWCLSRLAMRLPEQALRAMGAVLDDGSATRLNLAETMAGLGFGVVMAKAFEKTPPDWIHAGWATMPATAAWLLHRLTGIPFSMGAHAYDVFHKGGDCLLDLKLAEAALVHTTTAYARRRLLERGADPAKVMLIRRGLESIPTHRAPRSNRTPLRLISAGRFVEKKGWLEQLRILAACRAAGLRFTARIIGEGPMASLILRERARLGLGDCVTVEPWLDSARLLDAYAEADVYLFTGKVARNGDRDGLPNVVPEAMARGRIVVGTPVAGVPEAVEDGRTGFIREINDTRGWVDVLRRIQTDDALCLEVGRLAFRWVGENFDNRRNAAAFADRLHDAVRNAMREQ